MFKSRKIVSSLAKIYYQYLPDFILRSERFHRVLFSFLIGPWFRTRFKEEYKTYKEKDWVFLYDQLFENRIRNEDLTSSQKKYILDHLLGTNILEIGSGTGTVIDKISQQNPTFNIIGNDLSHKAIIYLKKKFARHSHLSFVEGDFLKIVFNQQFDTILCLHVLEHIKDARIMADKMSRLGKRLIVIVPCEKEYPYMPNYHLHFFNEHNPVTNLFMGRRNVLKSIDNDYLLVSDP